MKSPIAERVANRYAAGNAAMVADRIGEAIKALSYLPVQHAFTNRRDGMANDKKVKEALKMLNDVLAEVPVPVSYQVVGFGRTEEFKKVDDLIKFLGSKGIRMRGTYTGGGRRELQGQPLFDKLIGPIYGGPKKVRYETQEAYDFYST